MGGGGGREGGMGTRNIHGTVAEGQIYVYRDIRMAAPICFHTWTSSETCKFIFSPLATQSASSSLVYCS